MIFRDILLFPALFFVSACFLFEQNSPPPQGWKKVEFPEGDLCLNTDYDWQEYRWGEWFTIRLEVVSINYPYQFSDSENRTLPISVHLRWYERNELPDYMSLTGSIHERFDESLDLHVYQLADDREIMVASEKSRIIEYADPPTFNATCKKNLPQLPACHRPFQDNVIGGYYSFHYDSLKDWQKMEAGLERFLREKVARACD